MIIKRPDSKQEQIKELESLLRGDLNDDQRSSILSELKAVKDGVHGEKESAYYIDFYFEHSRNWAVIHDLRLKYKGKVAQIDHLLINRFFDIYVLESKNYSNKLRITPRGDFEVHDGNRYIGIFSPIEQNKRHIFLLDRFLKYHNILPKRMGIAIRPRFKNLILVSPKSRIENPPGNTFDTSFVIKGDTLRTKIDELVDTWKPLSDIAIIGKVCSSSTLRETAKRLVEFHKPAPKVDFKKKFGLTEENVSYPRDRSVVKKEIPKKYSCSKCNRSIPERIANLCLQNKEKFGGKIYCYRCRKEF